jgi:molybdate transport system substrate-binding protein
MLARSTSRKLGRLLPAATLGIGLAAPDLKAAEVSVLSASALKIIVTELSAQFQKESGHTPKLEFATAGAVEKRVLAGETPDVIIATDVQMKGIAEKSLTAGGPVVIARVGVGIAVKEGTPKPDISNAEALKKTLLAVKSVTYPDPAKGGASGIHFAWVIDKLGIAEPIRAKSILGANPDFVCVSVARGEADMCVHQISEIMPVKGVALVGPLPKEVQKVTTFAVAASAKAPSPDAANAFARFLARADLKAKFAAAGLDYKID